MAKLQTRDRNKNKPGKAPNWEYRFEGSRVAGKRTSVSKCGFKTKKEAEAAGARALSEYYSVGKVFKPAAVSFHDLVDKWFDLFASVNLRDSSIISYRQIINKHLMPAFGSLPVISLTSEKIQAYLNQGKKDGYSYSHVSQLYSLLRSILDFAVEPMHYIAANPCVYVRLPHFEPSKGRVVVTPDKWDKIISYFHEGTRFYIPLMIGYYTGMRISEVTGLTWDCFNPEKKKLSVKYQMVYESGVGCFLCPPKTEAGVRDIIISDELVSALCREKKRQEANRELYGEFYKTYALSPVVNGKGETIFDIVPAPDGFNFICSDDNGASINTNTMRNMNRKIREKLGITDFDFHSLRHTHATVLVAGGANFKAVQTRMGHQRIETTLQTYAHATDEMNAEAAEIFNKFAKK